MCPLDYTVRQPLLFLLLHRFIRFLVDVINDSSEFPPYNPTNKIEYLGTNSDNRSVGSDSMDVTDT